MKYAHIFFIYILVIPFCVIFFYDLACVVLRRLKKRSNGLVCDGKKYFRAIYEPSLEMIVRPKRVRSADINRYLLIEKLKILSKKEHFFSWPDALLVKGVLVAGEYEITDAAKKVILNYYDKFINNKGELKFKIDVLDQTFHGENLIRLNKLMSTDFYDPAIKSMATYLLMREVTEGALRYRKDSEIRYVDSLGMICPFLYLYGDRYKSIECRKLAVHQLKDFVLNGLDDNTALPFQGYLPTQVRCPVGAFAWGRGAGWLALGLCEILGLMPKNDPDFELLRSTAAKLSDTFGRFRRAEGGWGGLLNVGAPFDSSTTSMLAYFLLRLLENKIVTKSNLGEIKGAIDELMKHTFSDGVVGFSQSTCMGLGRLSGIYEPTPYAQGMTLAAIGLYLKQGGE